MDKFGFATHRPCGIVIYPVTLVRRPEPYRQNYYLRLMGKISRYAMPVATTWNEREPLQGQYSRI